MRYTFLILLTVLPSSLFSQINRKDTLREVLIKDKKNESIQKIQTIDSNILIQYQQSSLQNLLQLHSNVFVKNYGIGSLSTISIRGSSAAQTAVRWHGMNINNAMTGITDFSILPVAFFDEIKINYSGTSTNALGGNIELNNKKPVFKKQTEINTGAAYESLQNGAGYASVVHTDSKYAVTVKGFYQRSENVFKYYNKGKEKFENLLHADSKTKGFLADLYVKLFPHQTLSLHFWAQESNREIPPALFENISSKNETNQSLKVLVEHEMALNKWSSRTTIGLIQDQLDYTDSLIAFSSHAKAVTVPATYTVHWFPSSQQKLSLQTSGNYSKLLSGHPQDIRRGSVSLHYEVEPRSDRLFITTFIQKEYTNVFLLPLIAGLNIKHKIFRENYFITSVSSNYRMPTLNELYFMPGGNKNLKPENSRNLEGGLESKVTKSRHSLYSHATLFTREVKNWIVWYGGSILTPHNIQKVWSRGLEVDISYRCRMSDVGSQEKTLKEGEIINKQSKTRNLKPLTFNIQPSTFNFQLLYTYTLSTTKESAIANDYSIDKQIPYVPRYQLKLNLGYTKNAFDFSYVYAYTGYRFVTTDESEYLLPYNTHNIFASYKLHLGRAHQLLTTFKVNNIFNKNYESIIGRVMPGRTFSVGLNYNFKN